MNRSWWSFRVLFGAGLVILGVLMLLDRMGILPGVTRYFWGAIFLAGGAYFLYRFIHNMQGEWWAAIPAFALLGIGAEDLLAGILGSWTGFFFLGGLGLGFFAAYASGRERWWALIPGGVLITLGATSVLTDVMGARDTGGIFFLGLGLTFLLVAVLASLEWAWIPGILLLVIGVVLGAPFAGAMNYVWPAALILGGLLLILQFVRNRR